MLLLHCGLRGMGRLVSYLPFLYIEIKKHRNKQRTHKERKKEQAIQLILVVLLSLLLTKGIICWIELVGPQIKAVLQD